MAKRTRQGGLVGKLGAAGKKGMTAHKGDETSFDTGGDLPAGIEGGVAQLVDCKFDTNKKGDNKGEYHFYAAGIIKQPLEHAGVPIEGLRTFITESLYSTPSRSRQTVDEHLEWVLNELRKLGVDTAELGIDNLEDAAAALKEEQPHFRFRTWKGEKQTEGRYKDVEPRVNHVWSGACKYEEDGEEDDVVDATGEEEPEEEDERDTQSLQALGEAADEGDEEAEASLSEKAEEVAVDPNDFPTWVEVATTIEDIEAKPDEGEDEEEEEEEGDEDEDFLPEKGEVFGYKPPRKRKAVQCEVLVVFPRKKTCNLESLDDKKVYKGVPFDKLEGDGE